MTILKHYLTKTILQATGLVMVVVLSLVFLINFLGELKDIERDYTFLSAFLHVALELPRNLYEFFPMLALLGTLIGLSGLASHHELVVMRSAGMSLRKIATSVLTAAVIMAVPVMLIGETVAPQATYLAESQKKSEQMGGQVVATKAGIWIHEGNNFLHIDKMIGLNHMEGVTRYQFDHHQLRAAYYVKALDFDQGEWRLKGMVKTLFTKDHLTHSQAEEARWDLILNPNLLMVGLIEPEEMSLLTLHQTICQLKKNGLSAHAYQFAFWKRLFQVVNILVMVLIAIPFVFHFSRSTTMGRRILSGIMVGFAFYIANAFLGQFSMVFQIPAILAAIAPACLFAAASYFILWRKIK